MIESISQVFLTPHPLLKIVKENFFKKYPMLQKVNHKQDQW